MIGALAARNNLRVKNARQPVKRKLATKYEENKNGLPFGLSLLRSPSKKGLHFKTLAPTEAQEKKGLHFQTLAPTEPQ